MLICTYQSFLELFSKPSLESVQVLTEIFSEFSVPIFLVSCNSTGRINSEQSEYFTFLTPHKHTEVQLNYLT